MSEHLGPNPHILDMHSIPEDTRIQWICAGIIGLAKDQYQAVLIDSIPGKIARYKEKILKAIPGAFLHEEVPGCPVPNVTTLKFGRKDVASSN